MPPELHLDPDRLRAHAATVADLSEDLRVAARSAPLDPVAERLRDGVLRSVRELTAAGAALAAAAAAAVAADDVVTRALEQVRERP